MKTHKVQVGGNHYREMKIQPIEYITKNDKHIRILYIDNSNLF